MKDKILIGACVVLGLTVAVMGVKLYASAARRREQPAPAPAAGPA